MLLDLLSNNYTATYNVRVANYLGINVAIYLSRILDVYEKVVRSNSLVEDKYMTLDDDWIEYIAKHTALTKSNQEKAEQSLIDAKLIERKDENHMALDIDRIAKIFADESVTTIQTKRRKRNSDVPTKREAIFNNLKTSIATTNDELRQAYEDWIDSVCANPKGFLSKKSIQIFQKTVDDFSNHDLDVALKLIEIATVGGFRDATWAIESYKRQFGNSPIVFSKAPQSTTPPKLSEVVY